MNKVILTTILATATLWAVNATVKYENVKVKIGDEVKTYKRGATFEVEYNQKVCLLSKGFGLVMIDEYGQIDEDKPCGTVKKSVDVVPETTISVVLHGVTRKIGDTRRAGANIRTDAMLGKMEKELVIDKNATEIIIENKTWGPLPITLTVVDKEGKEQSKKVNKNNALTTRFSLSNKLFQNGDKFVVTNKNGDRLAEITVKFKK